MRMVESPPSRNQGSTVHHEAQAFLSWRSGSQICAGLCLLLGCILLVNFAVSREEDPLRSTELKQLKAKLEVIPNDENLKVNIRHLDLQLRKKYFDHLIVSRFCAYLLVTGVVAFLVAGSRAYPPQLTLPITRREFNDSKRAILAKTRWSILVVGICIGLFLLVLGLKPRKAIPESAADINKLLGAKSAGNVPFSEAPSSEVIGLNWPRLFGPNGNGSHDFGKPALHWDAKTGQGIAWKSPVPVPGFNSPIVWSDHVFLSGGDSSRLSVFCFNGKSGKLLWQQPVTPGARTQSATTEIPQTTGYAASSMATDGSRVFAMFATGDLAAFDFNGVLLWSRCLGPLKNTYGHASSLITWKGRLIAQVDQGEAEEGKSRLYALDGKTGQVNWQQARSVGSSWSTPAVLELGNKTQIITVSVPHVQAYSFDTGAELWRVDGINGEVTPSPITAAGLVLAISPSEKLLALRPDGQGNVTKTHILWSTENNVPDITTPASNGELLFTVTTGGILSCYSVKTGIKNWEHDFDLEFDASPSIAGDQLFLFSKNGHAIVLEAAAQFRELFRSEMPDAFVASPAFAKENIYLRGATNLWCLGPTQEQLKQ
jgi:outer membrane protein assembly factor BamB